MALPARSRPLLPDLNEWIAEAFPPALGWRTVQGFQNIRVETYMDGDDYVVRAELPGIDPEEDLQLTMQRGVLTIRAERSEEDTEKNVSEFRYGSFARSIRLPEGAREDNVTATYQDGVLTIRVGLDKPSTEAKKIPITRED